MSAVTSQIYFVEVSDNLSIIDRIWGKDFYETEFPNDNMIYRLLVTLEEMKIFSKDIIEGAFKLIFTAFHVQLPKMIVTYDCLLRFIKRNDLKMEAIHKRITSLRHGHFALHKGATRGFKYPAAERYFEKIYIELPKPILNSDN